MRRSILAAALFAAASAHGAITGTLMTPEGVAISGARVSLVAYEAPDARAARRLGGSDEPQPLVTVASDARGRFALDMPRDRELVRLRIDAVGRIPYEAFAVRDFEFGAIPLSEARSVRGCVTGAGKPVAGARVLVSAPYAFVTRTDGKGCYEIPDANRARIAVIHTDYAIAESNAQAGGTARLDFVLSEGITLRGTAIASDGSPVAGARVFLDGWPLATSGEDGTFTIAHASRHWKTLTARTETLAASAPFDGADTQTLRMRPTAEINGRVTDMATGGPVAGALILVAPPRYDPSASIAAPAITDAKGRYTQRSMPGKQSLHLVHPLYVGDFATVTAEAGNVAAADIEARPLSLVAGRVVDERKHPVVAASITVQDADPSGSRWVGPQTRTAPDGSFIARYFIDEPAMRVRAARRGGHAAMSDVFEASLGHTRRGVLIVIPDGLPLSGRVTTPDGTPLAGVQVAAVESSDHPARRHFRRPTTPHDGVLSSADGTFTLELTEGTYDISFGRDGYAPKALFDQKVARGSLPELEITMHPGLAISGRVTRGGAGVADVQVQTETSRTSTDAEGAFSLDDLSPGTFEVIISKPNDFVHANRMIEAPATDVHFELGPGRIVAGRVIDRKSKGPVTSFTAGISRSVVSGTGSRGITYSQPFTSDDGSFRFENVPEGAIEIVVQAPGFSGASIKETLSDRDLTDVLLELDPGIRITGRVTGEHDEPLGDVYVDASLRQARGPHGSSSTRTRANGEYVLEGVNPEAEAITFQRDGYLRMGKPLEITGSEMRIDVQLSKGQPFTGSVVRRSGAAVEDAIVNIFMNGPSESARTDVNGRFTVTGLPPGTYIVDVKKQGLPMKQLHDVELPGTAPLRVVMDDGATISGRITGLLPSDLPLVTVSAFGNASHAEAAVDAAGNYRLEGAPEGNLSVFASLRKELNERRSEKKELKVTAGQSYALDLEFQDGVTIRGQVARGSDPLAGATISFLSGEGQLTTTTNSDGRYEVSGLAQGPNRVIVSTGPGRSFHTTCLVRAGGTCDIAWPAGSIRGYVLDASNGEPLPNARLSLRPNAYSPEARSGLDLVTSDNSGAFTIEAVLPGSYALLVSRDDFGTEAIDVMVGSSEVAGIEVRLRRSAGVSVVLVDGRNGQKIRGWVSVYDARGQLLHQASSPTTDLPIRLPLAPGSYTAVASAPAFADQTISVPVPSQQTVVLTPGGTIEVRGPDSRSRSVRLLDSQGLGYPRRDARHVFPHGAGTLKNIAPGTYTLQVLADDGSVATSRQVTVQEGAVTRVDL